MQRIGPNAVGKSAVATLDGRSRKERKNDDQGMSEMVASTR